MKNLFTFELVGLILYLSALGGSYLSFYFLLTILTK
jgi:hypothetical protein